jgi:N-methylhydantoinase B
VELLSDCDLTLLADRRRFAPWGLGGGEAGKTGRASLSEAGSQDSRELPGKCSVRAKAGSVLRVETPGGGGWGRGEG